MGLEVRKAPPGWEHPKNDEGKFVPLQDESYEDALNEWLDNHWLWMKGDHPDQLESESARECKYYAQWGGDPPGVDYYRLEHWSEDEATCFAAYETVSEGKPVTPFFPSKEELVEFLCTERDFWGQGPRTREAAQRFVDEGFAPTLIVSRSQGVMQGIDHIPEE